MKYSGLTLSCIVLCLSAILGCADRVNSSSSPLFYPSVINEGAKIQVQLVNYGELRELAAQTGVLLPAHHEEWPERTTTGLMVPRFNPPSVCRYMVDTKNGIITRIYLLNGVSQATDLMACAAEYHINPSQFLVVP